MAEVLDQSVFRHKIGLDLPSLAVAIEALDDLLAEKGILGHGELMKRAEELAKTKVLPGGDG